ncbi:MAG: LamG-like jellyroll fold domain-containing protein [Pseudonocardia sp.]
MRSRWTRRVVVGALVGAVVPVGLALGTASPATAAESSGDMRSFYSAEDTTDAYGNSALTWSGGAAWAPGRSGAPGDRAFDLGDGRHLTAAGPAAANFGPRDFTVRFSALFGRSGAAREQVLAKSAACGTGLDVTTRDGRVRAVLGDGTGTEVAVAHPTDVHDGRWHEVTLIRSGPTLSVQVDGVAASGRSDGRVDLDNAAPLRLGAGPCPGATPADVALDDVSFGPGTTPVGPPVLPGVPVDPDALLSGLLPGQVPTGPQMRPQEGTGSAPGPAGSSAAESGALRGGSGTAGPGAAEATGSGGPVSSGEPGASGSLPGAADGIGRAPGSPAQATLDGLPVVPGVLRALGSVGGTTPLPAVPVVPAGPPTEVPVARPGPAAASGPAGAGSGAPTGPDRITQAMPIDATAAGSDTPGPAEAPATGNEAAVVPLSGSWTGRAALDAAAAVPAPDEVRTDATSVVRSAMLALVLLTLLVLPARLVNRTADVNAERIVRRLSGRIRRTGLSGPLVGTGVTITAYAAGAPLLGLDASSIALALGLAAAFLLVTAVAEVTRQILLGRSGPQRGHLRRVPGLLLLGLATVVATRVLGVHAGLVAGAFAAIATSAGSADYISLRAYGGLRDGRAKAVAAASLATLGAVAWMLRDPLLGPAGAGFAGQFLASGLTAVTVTVVVHLAFAMIPVRFLDGAAVLDWSRSRWALLAGLGAFALVHVVLQPAAGPALDRGGFLTGVVGVHLAAVALFVLWFRLRRTSPAEAQAVG